MTSCPWVAIVLRHPAGPGVETGCVKPAGHGGSHRFVLPDHSIAVGPPPE